jgi:hypothetical protein
VELAQTTIRHYVLDGGRVRRSLRWRQRGCLAPPPARLHWHAPVDHPDRLRQPGCACARRRPVVPRPVKAHRHPIPLHPRARRGPGHQIQLHSDQKQLRRHVHEVPVPPPLRTLPLPHGRPLAALAAPAGDRGGDLGVGARLLGEEECWDSPMRRAVDSGGGSAQPRPSTGARGRDLPLYPFRSRCVPGRG